VETWCDHFYVAGSLQIIRTSNPLLFKSVLVAEAAGYFISLAYVGNGWTTIVLLLWRFSAAVHPNVCR